MKPGFASRQFGAATLFFALMAWPGCAAELSLPITGNLLGAVANDNGTPQMGATVQLFDKYEKLIAKRLTTADGRFAFPGLPPDLYSVRVSLASFLPASRDKIAVKAGIDSVLQIHLATLFSNIEISYTIPDGAMSNDWKWVLRSSPATRPITRYLPVGERTNGEFHPRIFSETHAMLSMSGGDGGLIDSDSVQGDFGTGFALSTNILGKNQVQLGGTIGQNGNFGPSAIGLAAIYSRSDTGGFGNPPEVALTVTQLGGVGPQLGGPGMIGGALSNGPIIRTMSLGLYEVTDPTTFLHIEYGMTGESVEYLQHTSRVSPFGRVTVDAGKAGQVIAAYSDGGRPDELSAHQRYQPNAETARSNDDLADAVNALARLPQVSERNGQLELQRTQNYELGYHKQAGSRTYAVSGFHEDVSNGRINVAGDVSALNSGDLLWDGTSTTSTFNVGNYRRSGYIASVNQKMTDALDLAIAYGRMGGFTGTTGGANGSNPSDRFLAEGNHNMAAANLQAQLPVSGTRISASYGWVDTGTVIPRHVFTTQNIYVEPGLNVYVRQPLPSMFGMPGRLEVTADLRNLLSQGYLPFSTGNGRTLLMVQSPRAIRGGLNFIF